MSREYLQLTLAKSEIEQTELPNVIAVVRLLALTGCRLSEILTLKWDHIDFQAGILNLPDAKAGARSQSLATPALHILISIKQNDGIEWVLPNNFGTGPFDKSNMERAWRRIRKRAGIEDIHMHDLRRTVGTIAGTSGANASMVRDLLGHKTLAMTSRYVNLDVDPQRELVNKVANQIDAAMSSKPSAEIIDLTRKR